MRKPWNLPELPVHSLMTSGDGERVNMNICTYVTAVSMRPKRYAIAVYHGTRTLENLRASGSAVLQVLHPDQIRMVRHLGFRSGMTTDKDAWLRTGGRLSDWGGHSVLTGASALVELRMVDRWDVGDHDLYLFDAGASKTLRDAVLTTGDLRRAGIIR
jgi:flavin reductase (DIM6/NTAB) family NADH-FMN oxidoreductase RutF